ncbi:hypothetical protein ACFPM7_24040 [Actinokineospora guangxiensis]|uniref:Uncharacterized protein n=1 Tax=Actinokineospora guangxiensis TaxID=1490288 RepID=A0ABW0ERU5_9PSEU
MRNRVITACLAAALAIPTAAVTATPAAAAPASAHSALAHGHGYGFDVRKFVKGRTELTLDPAAAQALTSLGVTVKPFLAGTRGSKISFAIVGNPKDGTIEHIGGLLFQAGRKWLLLSNYTIDLNRGVLTGLIDLRQRAPLFTLGAPTSQGVTLALTDAAADLLNTRFGVTAFTEGLVIGYGNPILR